jgi:cell volume regulation protein A
VAPILKFFGFDRNEITLVSWVGLRGSVPIILAIFPLLFGLPDAPLIFNVVFFVVLISATVQGSTLPLFARRLGLSEPPPPAPAATLQITSIRDVNADIVEYTMRGDSRAVGRRLSQLALPEGTVVAMITRHHTVIPPRGSTVVQADDHLYVVLRPEARPFVDRVFSQAMEPLRNDLPDTELRLKGWTTVEDLRHSYDIHLNAPDGVNLHEILRDHLQGELKLGASVILESTSLWVRELVGQRVSTVGLVRAEKR